MKEPALVIIKPDGISKGLVGKIFAKFDPAGLDIVGLRVVQATQTMAEKHYKHLRGKPFFDDIVAYLVGEYHPNNKLIVVVYYGPEAIKKCRDIAGATSPQEASAESVRGAYGQITEDGLFENVVHVSSDAEEAEREIKLWFDPDDIAAELYSYEITKVKSRQQKVWI